MTNAKKLTKLLYNQELHDLDTRFMKALSDASERWMRVRDATGVVQGAPADAIEDCERLYDEPKWHWPTAPIQWHKLTVPISFTADEIASAGAAPSLEAGYSAALECNIHEAQANSVQLPPFQPPAPKRDGRLRGTVLVALPKSIKRSKCFRRHLRLLRDKGSLGVVSSEHYRRNMLSLASDAARRFRSFRATDLSVAMSIDGSQPP